MSDAAPPLPFPTPPSIEASVKEHLDVVHELREMRIQLSRQGGQLDRLTDAQTVDRLTIGRVEKYLLVIMKHLGVRE